MIFDSLGGLPLGGIPDALVSPVPPPSGAVSSNAGGSYFDQRYSRRWEKEMPEDELAILLAAYMQYYKD